MRRSPLCPVLAIALLLTACDASSDDGSPDTGVETEDVSEDGHATDAPDAGHVPDAADGGDTEEPWRACSGLYAKPAETARLDTDELKEVSGVAVSRLDAGVLWMHNDAGALPRLYAVATDGRLLARVTLEGVTLVDTEDIAAADCPDGSEACLWLADTGSNDTDRNDVVIHVIPEPVLPRDAPSGGDPVALTARPVASYALWLPDKDLDLEALAVTPDGRGLFLFEKVDGDRARVFAPEAPLRSDAHVRLVQVARFDSPGFAAIERGRMVTAADLHRSGRRLLVRLLSGTYEYRLGPGQTVADIGAIEPLRAAVGPMAEAQGEAVAYDAEGLGFWTLSEEPDGFQPLHHCACEGE